MQYRLRELLYFNYKGNHENPCKVSPSYVKCAPWIGPLTRASKIVLNTEYAKLTAKKSDVEQADIEYFRRTAVK